MGKPRTKLTDYLQLAEHHHLDYLQDFIPESIDDRAPWWCRITGQHFLRSFSQVKNGGYPSNGQRFKAEFEDRFHEVARSLGIEFVYLGKHDRVPFPQTTKHPARWVGPNKRVLWASYNEIGYGRVTQEHGQVLGIFPGESLYSDTCPTVQQYQELAAFRQFKVLDSSQARSVDDRVMWQCLLTRQIFAESYRTVEQPGYLSEGQAYMVNHKADYERLADSLDITFVYHGESDIFPPTEQHPARWRNAQGVTFWASLNDLSGNIRSSFAKFLDKNYAASLP